MENNAFNASPAPGIDEMDLTGIEGSEAVSDNPHTSTSASVSSSEFAEDFEPVHVKAPVSHSFTDNTNFRVVQEFESTDELKNNLQEATMKSCFEMKIVKSSKTLYVVKCVNEHCTWRLRAVKVLNSNFFTI
ncbi:hypothetical protein TIFTF001_018473 [Ficus carica]|uniref:Transposase MuDR plant domain-containing protein n=1 Tax=Ficus carica TaxID=3494 RepID=A0AA88A9U0_FICCA|nr:hypothetical protein TIFTF001_018473 [Ficus carica]